MLNAHFPRLLLVLAALFLDGTATAAQLTSWLDVRLKAEAGWYQQSEQADYLAPWYQGGVGQSSGDTDELRSGPVLAALKLDTGSDWSAVLHLSHQQQAAAARGITEGWLQYQPLPWQGYRVKVRAGWFYPALSVENSDLGWSSPYSSSFSALNSWYAEELRARTVEFTVSRPGRSFGSDHSIQAILALYQGNDPLGSLLAWRGFASHNLQTRLGGRVDFAAYPSLQRPPLQLQPGWVEPFTEIDQRTGWYSGLHYQYLQQLELRFYHYDNNADPTAFARQQYAWRNRFDQWAAQWQLNEDVQLLGQWARGRTEMGQQAVVVDYQAGFLLLSYQSAQWQAAGRQLALRYDRWRQWDRDLTPGDDNSGRGHGLTLSLQQSLSDSVSLLAEFSRLHTEQASRAQWQGWPVQQNFYQSQLSLIWRFD